MKNTTINDLKKKIEMKQAEESAIQVKIDELSSALEHSVQKKEVALSSNNNAEYITAHQEYKRIADEIEALKSMLKDKQAKRVNSAEISSAWANTVAEFESDRARAVKEYQRGKEALAMKYLEFCRAENRLNELRAEAHTLLDPSLNEFLNLPDVPRVEKNRRNANTFFQKELNDLGFSQEDLFYDRY